MPNFASCFRLVVTLLFAHAVLLQVTEVPRAEDVRGCNFCVTPSLRRCFKKSDWCDGTRDCSNGIDEQHCISGYSNCTNDSLYRCESGGCIPRYWTCDGVADCPNGSDEIYGCAQSTPDTSYSKRQLRNWIISQQDSSWGWGKDTPRAIVAMYLMNQSEFSSRSLKNELVAKELEAQLSFDLFRNYTVPLDEVKMAQYIHAMLATCYDPTNFHGFNLVSTLNERISRMNFIRPIALLALCNAGHPVSKRNIAKLVDILTKPNDPVWIDTKALATMALSCVVNQTNDKSLNNTVEKSLVTMKYLQNEDGSFGDVRTSALITQALVGNRDFNDWNYRNAIRYIVGQRKNDSNGMTTNYLIMPLISGHTLIDLRRVDCSYKYTAGTRNRTMQKHLEEKAGERVNVQYSIIIGDHQDVSFISIFRVPVNTTLFDLMKLASEIDNRYSFQWREHDGEKYINSINSVDNDPELRKYWTLYVKRHGGQPLLITQDVDNVYPSNRDHYVFWYKTVLEDDIVQTSNSTIFGFNEM